MLRGPDGYWIYKDLPNEEALQPFWKPFAAINQWTTENPGPLAAGDLSRSARPDAIQWVHENKPEGIAIGDGRIVARYDGSTSEVPLIGGNFDSVEAVTEGWKGRGSLPPLDESVFHSGRASIRFEPSAAGQSPRSPHIDKKIPEAGHKKIYEVSFWVKTAGAGDPIRFWVGRANSSQHPDYMYYANYFLPPDHDWMRLRTPITWGMYKGSPPLVLRFWCPPTDGKVWLDEVRLQPVQVRTLDIPLNPPADAAGWGTIDWKLSPADARCEADIEDPEDDHTLRKRLYPGDNVAPLVAVVGLKPVVLRLKVYPSPAETVVLEEVQIRFTSKSR
ncbi:MAG: hypothetical protein HY718_04105, partial [Planctomycetes bacterium]|nr:hypothetical protein [Planctomycetota bacterium]